MGDLYRIRNFNAISLSDDFPDSTKMSEQNVLANNNKVKLNVRNKQKDQTIGDTAFVGQIDNLQTTQLTLGMSEQNGTMNVSSVVSLPLADVDGNNLVLGVNKATGKVIPVRVTQQNTSVDAFKTIAVAGQTALVADGTDTLRLVGGTNVTIDTNATTDTITINAAGGGGGDVNAFKTIKVANQPAVVAGTADTLTLVGSDGVDITTDADTDTITIKATDAKPIDHNVTGFARKADKALGYNSILFDVSKANDDGGLDQYSYLPAPNKGIHLPSNKKLDKFNLIKMKFPGFSGDYYVPSYTIGDAGVPPPQPRLY